MVMWSRSGYWSRLLISVELVLERHGVAHDFGFWQKRGSRQPFSDITPQFWISSDNIESNMYLRYPNHKMRCPWAFSDTILEPGHWLLTQIAHGISRNITWYETTPPFIYFYVIMVLKREATQGYWYLLALHSQVGCSYAYFWAHSLVRYAGNQQPSIRKMIHQHHNPGLPQRREPG
jgi:hypothetical protein